MNDRGFVVIAIAVCLLAAVGIISTAAVKGHGNDAAGEPSQQSVAKMENNKTQ